MGWVAAADFHRVANGNGPGHPCRAYGKVQHVGKDHIIGAVATGSPSARLSHLGAKIAVRACLAQLANSSGALERAMGSGGGSETRRLFGSVGVFVLEQLRAEAFNHVIGVGSLATNLTVFIVGPGGVAAMRIGAGFVMLGGAGDTYAAVFPEGRASVSDTAAVSASEIDAAMQIEARSGPVHFVCAASAGIPSIAVGGRSVIRRNEFLTPLDRFARTASGDSEVHLALRSFLRSKHVSGKVDQDLGFAVCGYHTEQQRSAA